MTLSEKLSQGIGRRALVMIEVFPFFIVGTLDDVQGDHINKTIDEMRHPPINC